MPPTPINCEAHLLTKSSQIDLLSGNKQPCHVRSKGDVDSERATMAAAAHEISLGGIFRRRTLRAVSVGRCHPPASSSAREASVNGEASRRREMQIFRLSEWARMKTAICIQQLTENVSLRKFLTHIECFSSPRTILSNKYISLLHSLRCTTCKKQYTVSHQLVG